MQSVITHMEKVAATQVVVQGRVMVMVALGRGRAAETAKMTVQQHPTVNNAAF